MNYIDADQVRKLAQEFKNNGYGKYLLNLVKDKWGLLKLKLQI